MNTSPTIAELTKALSKAQGQFDHAKKDVKNEFFKSKYADLASVIDAVKKPLSDNGLAVIQTTEFTEDGKMHLITLLSHISGEWINGRFPINPIKSDPQGIGSAMTYARRYAYLAITGIASEDDDGNAASDKREKEAPKELNPATKTANQKAAVTKMLASIDKQANEKDVDAEYKRALDWAENNGFTKLNLDALAMQRDNTKQRFSNEFQDGELDKQFTDKMEIE